MFRLLKFARFGKKQESDPVWYRHLYADKSYLELLRRYVLSPKKHQKIQKFENTIEAGKTRAKKNTRTTHT